MKTALVTGYLGFLGRHFARELHNRGYRIRGVDIEDAERWDARDFYRFGTSHFDLAIHCAAVVGGRRKIECSPLELAVDLSLDAEFFQWAVRTQPGRVVYISSSAAYPLHLQTKWAATTGRKLVEADINLDYIANPDELYGWSKLTGEVLARYARRAGVPVTVVRPFSGYGADQSLDYPFPSFIARARAREDPFHVWGDGEQVRDWIHVDDIVAATLALAEAKEDGPVNLGSGRPVRFLDLAAMVCEEAGYRPFIEPQVGQPTGVRWRVADVTRLGDFYWPAVSLEDGIRRALRQEVAA